MTCPGLSEEECLLLRCNLLNGECMKLDFASVPDSFNSKACPSEFAMSLISFAGTPEEASANRDSVIDYDNNDCSLELHDCEHVNLYDFAHF